MSARVPLSASVRWLLTASAILLVCGLIVDATFTRSQLEAKRQLLARREALIAELRPIQMRERKVREMAGALGAPDLATAVQALQEKDPVTYLGRMVSSSGLVGREMGTEATTEEGGLRRTRFFVRVQGSFPKIALLVRRLEEGPRLVTIDALAIQQLEEEGGGTEGRLNLSVYSP